MSAATDFRPAPANSPAAPSPLPPAQPGARQRADLLARTERLCSTGSFELCWPEMTVVLSAGLRQLLGHGSGELADAPDTLDALHWIPPEERVLVSRFWRGATPGEAFEFQHGVRCADGRRLQVLHSGLLALPDTPGSAPVGTAILVDITARRDTERHLQALASVDESTGLANRAALLLRIGAAVRASHRQPRGFCLLSIEVPRIVELGVTLGHSAGDALTQAITERLRTHAGPAEPIRTGHDTPDTPIAHLGGGEFAWLLSPPTDIAAARSLALALQARLQAPVPLGDTEIYPLCRIGIASCPGDGGQAQALLAAAQAARLALPPSGGVMVYQPALNAGALRALQLETAMRQALAGAELSLVYQPQVSLASGKIVGAEALLRWQSAVWGTVPPEEFVPIAERSGLIVAIGDWVIQQVCGQVKRWRTAGLPPIRVSINLSPVQFQLGDVAQRIRQALSDAGLDASCLGLEVTEAALQHDSARLTTTLKALHAAGAEIVLDDFGTGLSNLSRLPRLPIDLIKVDRSFISDVTAAPEQASITRSIINLAHGLHIPVLAEGVETPGQLQMLVANGCDRVQGYLFSAPVTAETFAELLRSGRRLEGLAPASPAVLRTLLLVDDEPNILAALKRLFRPDGYRLLTAASGAEALELLAVHPVDVILSDQRMPGMTGVDFLRRTKELHPHTIRMTLSGFTDLQSIIDAVNEGAVYKFLTKPWDDERLRGHVAQAFAQKGMADDNRRLQREVAAGNADQARLNQRLAQLLDRQTEQSQLMQASAEGVRDLVDVLPAAVFGIDPDGVLTYLNQRADDLLPGAEACLGSNPGPQISAVLACLRNTASGHPASGRTVWINRQRQLAWISDMPGCPQARRGTVLALLPFPEPQPP